MKNRKMVEPIGIEPLKSRLRGFEYLKTSVDYILFGEITEHPLKRKMVEPIGIEPTTSSLPAKRSPS